MSLLLTCLLACGIFGGGDKPDTDADTDTDTDVDTDTDADGDSDVGLEDTGPYLEPEDPSFVAGFGSTIYEADEGRWLVVGAETWLTGNSSDNEVTMTVVVDGDLTERGRFPVESVRYSDLIDEDSWDFQYFGTGDAEFVVDGHDEELELLWGHVEGEVVLSDSEGNPDITMDTLELTAWP